jgi:hypothetical protein
MDARGGTPDGASDAVLGWTVGKKGVGFQVPGAGHFLGSSYQFVCFVCIGGVSCFFVDRTLA